MEASPESAVVESYREGRAVPLLPGPREFAAIVAFWLGYGLLTVANRFFDPDGGPPGEFASRATIAAIEALLWIIVTPILFAIAGRIDLDAARSTRRRWVGLLVLVLSTIAAAALLALIGRELRAHFTPGGPFGGGGGRRGRGGGPPPWLRFWFGFLNTLILSLGIAAAGVARAYSARLRARREQAIQLTSQLAEARIDALRRQLDPHFLFNTLNAIASLVERDPRGVRRMIARLGDLLRHSFEGGDAPEVPLRRELALLGLYVDIVRVRFQDRLTVDITVDDSVLDALVPTLILQPLVENSVKHGVEKRTDGGHIVVEGSRDGDTLVLRVRDDGGAFAADTLNAPSGRGVGVRNTRARLQQLYGNAQRFSLAREGDHGVVAEIRLPFHLSEVTPVVRVPHTDEFPAPAARGA
jgi:two-component system, LytTR family, sensor kinase